MIENDNVETVKQNQNAVELPSCKSDCKECCNYKDGRCTYEGSCIKQVWPFELWSREY